MKKTKLSIITLFLIVTSVNLNAQWQQDSKYGFKINIPANWSKSNYMDRNDKVYDYMSQDENAAIQLRVFEAGGGVTTDMLAQIYEENMLAAGTQKLSLENHLMNGIPCKQGIYLMDYNGVEVGLSAYYFSQNNKCYILTAIIPSSMIQQKGEGLKQILKSFIIDGFEAPTNIVKEEKKPTGLSGLLGGTSSSNNEQNNSAFSGSTSGGSGNTQSYSNSEDLVYQGQTYRTVKIGNQVWMAENLNVGTMVTPAKYGYDGNQQDNNVIEKYCYKNNKEYCDSWGGLYLWEEIMKYNNLDNKAGHIQGICPHGWHIPTDDEWSELEGFVDSEFKIGDNVWKRMGVRGSDVGKKLKSTKGWSTKTRNSTPNGDDSFGFEVLPVGNRDDNGRYHVAPGLDVNFWTATQQSISGNMVYIRKLSYRQNNVNRVNHYIRNANPVRCIKN